MNKLRKVTRWVYLLDEGPEIEFDHEPIESTILQRKVGDKWVVGYLAQEIYPLNPIKEYGDWELYIAGERNSDYCETHLGVAELNGDNKPNLQLNELYPPLFKRIQDELFQIQDFRDFCHKETETEACGNEDDELNFLKDFTWNYDWDDFVYNNPPKWLREKLKTFRVEIWEKAYKEGSIGSKFAVPVKYYESCHGPGTTSIFVTNVYSANAVLVPNEHVIKEIISSTYPKGMSWKYNSDYSHITLSTTTLSVDGQEVFVGTPDEAKEYIAKNYSPITYDQYMNTAEKIAAGVLKEFEAYCNGDVYGCVVQVFNEDGESSENESESVWGFYSYEVAKECLARDFFEPRCNQIEAQCGKQIEMNF